MKRRIKMFLIFTYITGYSAIKKNKKNILQVSDLKPYFQYYINMVESCLLVDVKNLHLQDTYIDSLKSWALEMQGWSLSLLTYLSDWKIIFSLFFTFHSGCLRSLSFKKYVNSYCYTVLHCKWLCCFTFFLT